MQFKFNLIMPFLTFIIFLCSGENTFAQVAVIANLSVDKNDISSGELLDFYSRDVRIWQNGEPVIVFDLKPKNEIKDTFYKFLGKSTSRMKSIWMKKMLSGEGDPPEAVESEDMMVQKVAKTPGSIGFVSQAEVTEDVKVLMVVEETKDE